jgi:hypothetical protein
VDSAVKEYKSEVIYIQWLKNMENAAVPLFWNVTVIDGVINLQVYAIKNFPNTG